MITTRRTKRLIRGADAPRKGGLSHPGGRMRACQGDCAGWPGVRRASAVAEFADPRAANPLESISRVAFHNYGLPTPLLQAEVLSLDLVDFLWDAYQVAGEADGMGKHVDFDVLRREKDRQERFGARRARGGSLDLAGGVPPPGCDRSPRRADPPPSRLAPITARSAPRRA